MISQNVADRRHLKDDNASDALACVHEVKAFVDLIECQHMRDHRVDLDGSVHIQINDLGDIGAALGPAERSATPVASCDELEWMRAYFLARLGNADDDRRAPAAVTGL